MIVLSPLPLLLDADTFRHCGNVGWAPAREWYRVTGTSWGIPANSPLESCCKGDVFPCKISPAELTWPPKTAKIHCLVACS